MQAAAPTTRGIKILFGAVIVTFAVLVGAFVADLVRRAPGREVDRIALAGVPEGPSLQRAGDRAVVLVRDGDDVVAFAAAVPARSDPVVWCAGGGHLATLYAASRYEVDGSKTGGPGPAELLRLEADVVDGSVEVAAAYPVDWPRTTWSDAAASAFANPPADVCTYATSLGS